MWHGCERSDAAQVGPESPPPAEETEGSAGPFSGHFVILWWPQQCTTPSCAEKVESRTGTGGSWTKLWREPAPSWAVHRTPSRRWQTEGCRLSWHHSSTISPTPCTTPWKAWAAPSAHNYCILSARRSTTEDHSCLQPSGCTTALNIKAHPSRQCNKSRFKICKLVCTRYILFLF